MYSLGSKEEEEYEYKYELSIASCTARSYYWFKPSSAGPIYTGPALVITAAADVLAPNSQLDL